VTSVLVHAMAARLVRRARAVPAFVVIGGVIGAALIGVCGRSYGLTPPTLAATLTYAFACELYIFLFTLVGNSVSFALLTRLASRPLKNDEIAGLYRAEAMIARRFEQLDGNDFITTGPAGVELTTRGKRIVRIFSLLHRRAWSPEPVDCENDLRGRACFLKSLIGRFQNRMAPHPLTRIGVHL
jgi:hypothetical protein